MSVHPKRLAAAFDPPVSEDIASRLLSEPRFSSRIDAMLGISGTVPERAALEALVDRAGIVLNARHFVREIRGPVIAEWTARFGADALAEARANVDLGWDRETPDQPSDLDQQLQSDGLACLAAWIAARPAPERRCIAVQWPNDDAVPGTDDPTILTLGPQILDRLMGAR